MYFCSEKSLQCHASWLPRCLFTVFTSSKKHSVFWEAFSFKERSNQATVLTHFVYFRRNVSSGIVVFTVDPFLAISCMSESYQCDGVKAHLLRYNLHNASGPMQLRPVWGLAVLAISYSASTTFSNSVETRAAATMIVANSGLAFIASLCSVTLSW